MGPVLIPTSCWYYLISLLSRLEVKVKRSRGLQYHLCPNIAAAATP